jgi:hypothetical protein
LTRFCWILPVVFVASAAQALAAQESREPQSRVPASFTPPAGLCRLWIDGVPASQQPAPTDCASAIRNRPANSTVVFGPQRRSDDSERAFTRRGVPPIVRTLVPNSFAGRARDEGRDRGADTAGKPATRKPEKPQ